MQLKLGSDDGQIILWVMDGTTRHLRGVPKCRRQVDVFNRGTVRIMPPSDNGS